MGSLHTKAADCGYHKYEGRMTQQYINGFDDEHDKIDNKGTKTIKRYQ